MEKGDGEVITPRYKKTIINSNGNTHFDGLNANVASSYDFYWHRGQDTDSFYRKKAKGDLLPMTKWTQYTQNGHIEGPSDVWEDNVTYHSTFSGQCSWFTQFYADTFWFPTNLQGYVQDVNFNALLTNAAAGIYAQGFDSLTFLAELHKTHRMLRGALSRNLKNVQSGRLYKNWLEGRYGWRIFLLECIDIYNTIQSFDESRERYKQSTGYSFQDISTETFLKNVGGAYEVEFTMNTTIDVSCRGTVVMDIAPPKWSFNAQLTAWELLPYSFVIDWIVHVGNWIESFSALNLSTAHTAAAGYKITASRTYAVTDQTWFSTWTGNKGSEHGQTVAVQTVRLPMSLPKLPQLRINLDEWKLLDLIALFQKAAMK
jgi:hypothetical protein